MFRRRPRGGIERKFLTSILWVGVVPMLLSVIIGFVFVYEGQQIAVERELSTAARKTSEGLQLALNTRLRLSARLTTDPDLPQVLRKAQELRKTYADYSNPIFLEAYTRLQKILSSKSVGSQDLTPVFKLYNEQGEFLVGSEGTSLSEFDETSWTNSVTETRFDDFYYNPEEERYVSRIVSPIFDPETKTRLGFLRETQGAQDLLRFALGFGQLESGEAPSPAPYAGCPQSDCSGAPQPILQNFPDNEVSCRWMFERPLQGSFQERRGEPGCFGGHRSIVSRPHRKS